MFRRWPCLSPPHSHFYLRPIFTSALKLSFSTFLHFNFHSSGNPKSRNASMSKPHERVNAFDALMSNARSASKKRSAQPSQEAPPPEQETAAPRRKRKSDNPIRSLRPGIDFDVPEKAEDSTADSEKLEGESVLDSNLPKTEVPCSAIKKQANSESKKPRVTAEEVVARISKLRNKAADFSPKSVAWWEDGERVPFLFVAKSFDLISKETGRIVITDIVCNMLRTVIATTPDDLVPVVYLLANRVAPAHEGLELGIGDSTIIKALAEACGGKEAVIKRQIQELGDMGLVAMNVRSSQRTMYQPAPLTVTRVFDTLRLIAKESGKDSQDRKKNYMKMLIVAAVDCEPLYVIRLLQTKLRIGLAEQTLLTALGHAAVYSEENSSLEEAAKIVKKVYSVLPVYDKIIPAILSGGIKNLPSTCTFTPGIPVGPMLAKAAKGVSEILEKFNNIEFACEYKYDGERAQIHYLEDGTVEIYSRNAERTTGKFPDVAAAIKRYRKESVKSFVLDCELVAYDREKKKILPFQILSTRARKNVNISDIKVNVCIFAFDILYLDGRPLLEEQLKVRKELLYDTFEEETGFFQFATAITSNDLDEIQKFLEDAVNASCEGLIIKTLEQEATYEPSKRSNNWIKLKKDYMDSVGDSLDLVPIAAFHGRGKRTGVYGAFLLACYDGDKEEFQSICKIGTGFTDAVLEACSTSLKPKVIREPKSYFRFGDSMKPDVWFEPNEVWEVKAADLTISPVHCAAMGLVEADKGISLRFPRLVRVREDKIPEDASSSEQVAEMYRAQKITHKKTGNDSDED